MQERQYSDAQSKLELLRHAAGPQSDIVYGLAVCDYQLQNYKAVVAACTELVNSAAKRHPGQLATSCWAMRPLVTLL